MTSRLFRSIVVFGAGLGATAGVVTLVPGCELYFGPSPCRGCYPDAYWSHISDAAWSHIADAPWGIIDAGRPDVMPDALLDAGSAARHDGGTPEPGESR